MTAVYAKRAPRGSRCGWKSGWGALLLLLASACASGTGNRSTSPGLSPPIVEGTGPGLTLVESVPLETSLDSPDVPDACGVWQELFAQARERLDLEHFYFTEAPNTCMAKVQQALVQAGARGVAVRIVADAKFAKTYPDTLARFKALPGFGVWTLDLKPVSDGVQHAKFMVADAGTESAQAFVGSQNFDWRSLEHIRELGVRIQEPKLVEAVAEVFRLDQALAAGDERYGVLEQAGWRPRLPKVRTRFQGQPVVAQVLASPPRLATGAVGWELPALLNAIEGARHTIQLEWHSLAIQGYDKSRWPDLDDALRRAAARGVQITLVVADWCKKAPKLEAIQGLAAVPGIDVHFSTIPAWSGGFIDYARVIHTKAMVVDGRLGWVGSSNGSGDYFLNSRNVSLMVEGEAFAQALGRWMHVLSASPYVEKVDPKAEYTPPKTR